MVERMTFHELMESKTLTRQEQADLLAIRLAAPVDAFTMSWVQRELATIHQEVIGLASITTRHAAMHDSAAQMRKEITVVEGRLDAAYAAIGELSARVAALEQRMERMSVWARQQQKVRPAEGTDTVSQ